MTVYPFNRGFRLKILALCLDPLWMSRYGEAIVRPEYFEQDDEEAVADAILRYYAEYGKVPRDPDDVVAMIGDYEELVYEIFDDERDFDMAIDVAVQFAKEQAAKVAILDSIDDVKVGAIDRIIERMEHVLAIGELLISPGIDPIRDADMWLYDLWTHKVKTGWLHVDRTLEGGLGPGELGIILGPTNRGKSMALVNIGYGAASIGSGKRVVHISHEMNERNVSKRYAARMVFRFPRHDDDLEMYRSELVDAARRLMPGGMRVVYMSAGSSVQDIRMMLTRLRSEGYEFDVVIDDYPDLLSPSGRYRERRFELTDVYTGMRVLANDFQVPVWGASQSTRRSFSKEIVTLGDIAEDIGKANIADVVIALCQTDDEAAADKCRLYMAKVRDGRAHHMVDAKFYGDSQAIITTGFSKRREKDA